MSYAIGISWIICSILSYGLLVGHFQGKYEMIAYETRIIDRVFAAVASLFGPFALLAWFTTCDHWEWRL